MADQLTTSDLKIGLTLIGLVLVAVVLVAEAAVSGVEADAASDASFMASSPSYEAHTALRFARAQSPVGAASLEVFLARSHAADLFPECSEGGVPACSADLSILVRKIDPNLRLPAQNNVLDLLPTPLLSEVLVNIDRQADGCAAPALISELVRQEGQSQDDSQAGLATTSALDGSTCYGVRSPMSQPVVALMWHSGKVYGWLSCDVEKDKVFNCQMFLYPLAQTPEGNRIYLELGGANQSLVPALLEHARQLGERINNLVNEHSGTAVYQFGSVYDISRFDEATHRLFFEGGL